MIGGTRTGNLIVIMLGSLRMAIDKCIDAYTMLSDRSFSVSSTSPFAFTKSPFYVSIA